MRAAAWLVEVAQIVDGAPSLDWEQAFASPGVPYAFGEGERQIADLTAIALDKAFGDEVIVRVRHRLGAKRGVFFPRPRPARRAA